MRKCQNPDISGFGTKIIYEKIETIGIVEVWRCVRKIFFCFGWENL